MVISCRWISPYSRILRILRVSRGAGCAAHDFPSFCRKWRDFHPSVMNQPMETYELHKEILGGSPKYCLIHWVHQPCGFPEAKTTGCGFGLVFGLAQLCPTLFRKCPKALCLRPGAGNADVGLQSSNIYNIWIQPAKKCDIIHEEHLNAWDLVVLHDGKHISFVGGARIAWLRITLGWPFEEERKVMDSIYQD